MNSFHNNAKYMDCIYCNTSLPDKGFFCPNCFKQVKCKHCSEYLLKDAKICIYCGEEIGQKTSDTSMNTIEFSENETERNFKASFTDTVGQSISDTFGMLLANKIGSRKPLSPALLNSNDTSQQQSTIDVDAEIVNDSRSDDTVTNEISVIPTLEEIKLRDLAKTETDWLLVYTYYASQGGNKQFTRDEIIQYYQDTERYTKKRKSGLSQYIKNITKSRYIKPTNETDFILLDKGKNKAIEIFNGNSISNSIKKKLPSEKNEEKAKPKKTSNSVEFIDLKLTLTEQKSLKAYSALRTHNRKTKVFLW